MHYWVCTLKMTGAITPLKACIYHYTNYPEEMHRLSFRLSRAVFTAALHFRALFLCPCFLQLHGFYWQWWRKHTKTVLSGGLSWLADPTTHSASNNFLALQYGLKTMEKKKKTASSYTGDSFHVNSQNSYFKIHIAEWDLQSRLSSNHLERLYTL